MCKGVIKGWTKTFEYIRNCIYVCIGICTEFAWNLHGICMEFARNLHGICMEFARDLHGFWLHLFPKGVFWSNLFLKGC